MVVRGQPIQEVRTGGTTLRGDSIVMSNAKPLFVINGKRSTQAEMDKLSPSAIESVEVVKGPTAVAKFGADASGGAIVINLKK
jgi:outer membrane receptor protein involved in Fe transport